MAAIAVSAQRSGAAVHSHILSPSCPLSSLPPSAAPALMVRVYRSTPCPSSFAMPAWSLDRTHSRSRHMAMSANIVSPESAPASTLTPCSSAGLPPPPASGGPRVGRCGGVTPVPFNLVGLLALAPANIAASAINLRPLVHMLRAVVRYVLKSAHAGWGGEGCSGRS